MRVHIPACYASDAVLRRAFLAGWTGRLAPSVTDLECADDDVSVLDAYDDGCDAHAFVT